MESVQLLPLLQQFLLTDFSSWALRRLFAANQVDLPISHWRTFVNIFATASENTRTPTHVAKYLVRVCLAVLRSTTVGTES